MADENALRTAVRLGTSVDALAALAAHVRVETEQLPADPAVRQLLTAIAAELLGPEAALNPATAAPVVGLARTFLRQAGELVENPGRSGGWDQVDVPLLQSVGRLSMGISAAVLAAERRLPDLGDRLRAADATFLDVGTGTGWLAIAIAQSHPTLRLVGLDIFEPALDLARANIEGAGLADRIELRLQDAALLDEPDGYDAIWLALPFLPKAAVVPIMDAAVPSLSPGGWLLPGTFAGPGDRLAELLTDLRTVRSGGHPWRPEEIIDLMATAGLADAQ